MFHFRMIRPVALCLGLSLAASAVSAAEGKGWYLGLKAGQSEFDINKDDLDVAAVEALAGGGAPVLSSTSTMDDSDTAWSLFVGYRFMPYVALEAQYLELGTAEYRFFGTVDPPGQETSGNGVGRIDFESRGFTLAGVGTLPIGSRFDLHARVGAYYFDTESKLTVAASSVRVSDVMRDSSQDLFYGAGAAFRFNPHWVLSLDWNEYKKVGQNDETPEEDEDASAITLGLTFRM